MLRQRCCIKKGVKTVLIKKESLDKFVDTLIGRPVVIRHQEVTNDNIKKVDVGRVTHVWFDVNDVWYWCDGIITDDKALNLINSGWSVSCSYNVTLLDDKGGMENNIPYDMEFLDGVFTHLALVDNPRYESAMVVLNSKTERKDIISDVFFEALAEVIAENGLGGVVNAKWNKDKHPRHPKGTPKGGQFAKIYTIKDGIPIIDEVIGLRSALNTNLNIEDCEGILKNRKIDFEYASAKFEILIYGYDDYKIYRIMVID